MCDESAEPKGNVKKKSNAPRPEKAALMALVVRLKLTSMMAHEHDPLLSQPRQRKHCHANRMAERTKTLFSRAHETNMIAKRPRPKLRKSDKNRCNRQSGLVSSTLWACLHPKPRCAPAHATPTQQTEPKQGAKSKISGHIGGNRLMATINASWRRTSGRNTTPRARA